MKSLSFARALVASSVLCLALPLACGDSEDNPGPVPNPNVGGEGGGETGGSGGPAAGGGPAVELPPGISDMPSTIECSESCDSGRVGLGAVNYYLDPCCTEADNACGLNTAFLESAGAMFEDACQPKNQPGDLDENCPSPPGAMIPTSMGDITLDAFPGCCRPSGVCGVVVNEASAGGGILPLGDLELGCVDAAPFFPGEDPVPCGDGPVGGAGGGSAGGAGPGAGGMDGVVGGAGGAGGAN
jgi:hypothetical protein